MRTNSEEGRALSNVRRVMADARDAMVDEANAQYDTQDHAALARRYYENWKEVECALELMTSERDALREALRKALALADVAEYAQDDAWEAQYAELEALLDNPSSKETP